MPDGHDPVQFVANQLSSSVMPPGESVKGNAADAVTVAHSDSTSEDANDDDGIYIFIDIGVCCIMFYIL